MLKWKGNETMFVKKTIRSIILEKGRFDTYDPPYGQSSRWKYWKTAMDPRVCSGCEEMQGTVYSLYEEPNPAPPLHPNCRCEIEAMKSVIAGFGTKNGINGADWWLKHSGKLPDYYISWEALYSLGYRYGKPPRNYAPGMMIYGGEYENRDGHLPSAPGRKWYEADINYYEGHRNGHRILWSNDGLIFVTYDHYHTFCEIM